MFGAADYLVDKFGISKSEARKILAAWIKAAALEALKKYFNRNVVTPLDFSCGWAIGQIDGEPIERLAPRKVFQMGWFLEPLEP